MTAKELAEMLDGREYGDEITYEEEQLAKENGLVAVFGYSDDNAELRGAINDEVGCYDGGEFYVTKAGLLYEPDCGDDRCSYYRAAMSAAKKVKVIWHDEGYPCWTYDTEIPHEVFRTYEDGEYFCEGIVFSINDL